MKILLPYVPAPTSEASFAYAVKAAKETGASLVVLASEEGLDPKKAAKVKDRRPLKERLEETGVPFELGTVPKRDDPAEDILRAAFDEEVDLIVIGMRHRTPIGRILFGDTSYRIIMESPVPVVCVKPEGSGVRPKPLPRGQVRHRYQRG